MIRVTLQAALVALVAAPALGAAQQSSASAMLSRAIAAYDEFGYESAVLVLDSALGTKQLTPRELVTAYKYAGAGNAVLGRTNASIRSFREAIKLDTAVALDPAGFSSSEIKLFRLARLSLLQGKPDSEFPLSPPPGATASATASATPAYGEIRLGTGMASGADFYVDGQPRGTIKAMAYWRVPAGVPVKLSIRSPKCTHSWDTTMVIQANAQLPIGRRSPTGCAP